MTALDDDTLADQLVHALNHGNWTEAERIAAIFDVADQDRQNRLLASPGALVGAALFYASISLKVFPLTPRSKVPLPSFKWRDEATTDPDRIRAWWAEHPTANVAVATGHLVDVIDIDGPDGVASWVKLIDSGTLPPVLGKVSTPRAGGTHLFVTADPERRNRAEMWPGVDIRANGGYVAAPPSVTDQGTYFWRTPLMLGGT